MRLSSGSIRMIARNRWPKQSSSAAYAVLAWTVCPEVSSTPLRSTMISSPILPERCFGLAVERARRIEHRQGAERDGTDRARSPHEPGIVERAEHLSVLRLRAAVINTVACTKRLPRAFAIRVISVGFPSCIEIVAARLQSTAALGCVNVASTSPMNASTVTTTCAHVVAGVSPIVRSPRSREDDVFRPRARERRPGSTRRPSLASWLMSLRSVRWCVRGAVARCSTCPAWDGGHG